MPKTASVCSVIGTGQNGTLTLADAQRSRLPKTARPARAATLARVAAVMRRIRPALAGESISVGDLTLDPMGHRVERRGRKLQLGPTEYRLLKFLMESPGRVFSRNQLLDGVWGTGSDIELRTVDVHIRRLRKAIEIEGAKDPVRTVRSAGYAIEAA